MRILTTAALTLTAYCAFAQVDLNKTVAVINGDVIKGDEYYHRMETLPNVGRVLDSGRVLPMSPGMLTILQLVDDHLVIQLAKDKGLMPTDQEIDDAIKESQTADPNFMQNWINSGGTQATLRESLRFPLIEFKLATEGITVSDQEVVDFYHKNQLPNLTIVPRNVQLRLIAVRDQAGEKTVDDNLGSGTKFEEVAKADSQDATSANGGELGTVVTDRLPKPVVDAIDKTPVGSMTPWVDVPLGNGQDGQPMVAHVKYLIEDKKPDTPIPYTPELKDRIRRKMMIDRGRAKNNVEQELSDERKKAKIQITNPQFAKEYEDIMKRFFNETVSVSPGPN